jgi:ribose 5-phosphate isomerase B
VFIKKSMFMKVMIGADHAGFTYKEQVKNLLIAKGFSVEDVGTHSPDSVDYPDFAHPVAQAVEDKQADWGILICGSGNGVAITANKHQGIRAALCWNVELARLARQHNDANVLCLPARFVSVEEALQMVEAFANTSFEGGRHSNRVAKISIC